MLLLESDSASREGEILGDHLNSGSYFPLQQKWKGHLQTGLEATFTVSPLHFYTLPSSNYSIVFNYLPVSLPNWKFFEETPDFCFCSPGFLVQIDSIHKWKNKKIKDHWDLWVNQVSLSFSLSQTLSPTKVGGWRLLFGGNPAPLTARSPEPKYIHSFLYLHAI